MTQQLIINNKTYKEYLNTGYYANQDGEIYSSKSNRIIKPLKRITTNNKPYYYIDIKGKHVNVHRIVYIAWNGPLSEGQVVRHIDDNSLNNKLSNLVSGNQKENIQDCFDNNHRVGNIFYLTLFDKVKQKTVTFCPAGDFIEYSGHPCQNGNLSRMFSRNWFKKRYNIVDYKQIENIIELKSVTTKADECKPVD